MPDKVEKMLEKPISLIKMQRQKSVVFAAFTEPFQLIYRLIIATVYRSTIPLGCSSSFSVPLALIAYAISVYVRFTIYFRILIPTLVYLIVVAITVRAILPYTRYDAALHRKRSINSTYGRNMYLTEDKVEQTKVLKLYRDINKTDEWIFGRINSLGGAVVTRRTKKGNKQIIIFGLSGSGKGTAQVILNTLQSIKKGIPCIVSSTKSDVYSATKSIAQAEKYDNIWMLNLRKKELKNSDGFNPLAGINGDPTTADKLAHCITLNTSVGENPDYWYRGEYSLLCVLIIVFSCMKGKDCSLPGIYRFLCSVETVEEFERMMDSLIKPNSPAYVMYQEFKVGPMEGELNGAAAGGRFSTFKIGAQTPKQQVLQGVKMRLDFLSNPDIAAILEHDDISIQKLCEHKSICYLVVDQTKTYSIISSIFFTLAFWAFEEIAEDNDGKLPNGGRVIIDEAFATGAIPMLADTIATCRSIGLELAYIIQDLPMLKMMYPDTWESILNNCSAKVLISTDDIFETAPYFSSLCGSFTALSPVIENGKETGRETEIKAELAPVDFIKAMGDRMLVILSESKYPLLIDMQHYWQDCPGSKINWKNPEDGKIYHAHPLLRYQKLVYGKDHVPEWRKKEKEIGSKKLPKPKKKKLSEPKLKSKAKEVKVSEFIASKSIQDAEDM